MLTDANTLMHIAKARFSTEERKKDERFPVLAVALVLEPLTYSQAKQLGAEVLGHCFTDKKHIQNGLTSVTVELDEDEHKLVVRMAEDAAPHCDLRQVRVTSVTITKRDGSDSSETKTKKVSPQQPTLRATFNCLVDPAEKVHRDFIAGFFQKSMLFTFEPEQQNLFTGLHTDKDDDQDDDEPELEGMAPDPDADAGDVLEDQPKKKRAKKPEKPRLVKGGATKCQVCGGPDATATEKALNGLPKGVIACDDCRDAVKRREVGVRKNEDGTLHITDGRRSAEGGVH